MKWPRDPRTRYTLTAFFALWALLSVVAWLLVNFGLGHWIELFNGATWPPQFLPSGGVTPSYDFWFYFFLSLRGVLNLGVVLTAVFAAYLFFSGRWEGLIMSKLNSVYRTSNVVLVEKVLQLLEDNKVEVPEKVEEMIRAEAKVFGTRDTDVVFRDRVARAAQSSGVAAH